MIRILLVVVLTALLALILYALLSGPARDSADPQDGSSILIFPWQGPDRDDHGEDDHDHVDVRVIEGPPEGYEVVDVPQVGSVTTLAQTSPSPQFDALVETLFADKFWVRECRSNGFVEQVLILTAQPDPTLGEAQFMPTERALEAWEAFMVQDIGQTLFPSLAQEVLDPVTLQFTSRSLDSRYAVFDVGSQSYQVHYGWVLNFVILTTSHNCLIATINDLYAPHSH